jgi:hypothetical protein
LLAIARNSVYRNRSIIEYRVHLSDFVDSRSVRLRPARSLRETIRLSLCSGPKIDIHPNATNELPDSIDSQNTISFKKQNRPLPLRPRHYNVIPTPTHINNTTERHPSPKTPEQCTRPETPIDNKASSSNNNNNNNNNNPDITGLDKRQSTPLRILPAIFLNAYRSTGSDYFFVLLPRGRAEDRSKHARSSSFLQSSRPAALQTLRHDESSHKDDGDLLAGSMQV